MVATYRPNSEVAIAEVLGSIDAFGQLVWTPREAGLVTLEGRGEELSPLSLTVAVKLRAVPTLGLVVLVLAAMILFGGNGHTFAKTFGRRRAGFGRPPTLQFRH